MTEECLKLLEKASRAIRAAETLSREGESDFAVGRAYYAMFYTASALLAARGRRFRKHSGVHAAFGAEFAKTAELDPKFHRWLIDAFDRRIAGDYGVDASRYSRGGSAHDCPSAGVFRGSQALFGKRRSRRWRRQRSCFLRRSRHPLVRSKHGSYST